MKDEIKLGKKDMSEYTDKEIFQLLHYVFPHIVKFLYETISMENIMVKTDYYDLPREKRIDIEDTLSMMPLNFAKAICLDFNSKDVLKIGKIILANTDNR